MATKTLRTYEYLGYRFKIDAYGYQVWKGEDYLGGASTGRDRKIHYTHARANIRDYTGAALLLPKGCPMNNLALVYLFISICAWFQANGWGLEIAPERS